jgi:hypothetical protein
VREIRTRFVESAEGDASGKFALPKAGELGKDEPDPVGALFACLELGECVGVFVCLRDHESFEVEAVSGGRGHGAPGGGEAGDGGVPSLRHAEVPR